MTVKSTLLAAVLCVATIASAQTYTFQTSPASGEFLTTAAGLVVRWENRAGSSPDSPGVATPAQVSVFLGYRDGQNPKILFPALNGLTSNVLTAGGSFDWQKMDFNSFQNGPAPARDAKTDWFIQLSDQSSGYKSNGQLFKIIEGTAGASGGSPSASGSPSSAGTASPPQTAPAGSSPSAKPKPSGTRGNSGGSQGNSSGSQGNSGGSQGNSGGSQGNSGGSQGNSASSQGAPAASTQTGTTSPQKSASTPSASWTASLLVASVALSQAYILA